MSDKMTLYEFKCLKENLENDMLDLINRFEEKTEVLIHKVDLGGSDDKRETEYVFVICNL